MDADLVSNRRENLKSYIVNDCWIFTSKELKDPAEGLQEQKMENKGREYIFLHHPRSRFKTLRRHVPGRPAELMQLLAQKVTIVSRGGLRLSPLGTSATICPIVPAPGDRWWVWSSRWDANWQGKPKYSEKTCPSVILSTTNPTWPDLCSNPCHRGGNPATNRLSYGTAYRRYSKNMLIIDLLSQYIHKSRVLDCFSIM
jgi:hypothetical protein